jgi:Zn finger protein HypA/HybF involved in hydrogenase expression
VDGYDADGFDSDRNDREGKDALGNESISDESRRLLEASYKPISCLYCREELPELWREIRDDYCPDCLRKGLTVNQEILDIYG